MPQSIVLYKRYGILEWANKYYVSDAAGSSYASTAVAIRDAELPLLSSAVSVDRYEHLDDDGTKLHEGLLVGVGTNLGEILPINYAALIRLASTGPKRPSVKYLHGITESMMSNGAPGGTFLTNVASYGEALEGAGVVDSDGAAVTEAIFRRFTRRRRMRRQTA